MNEDKLKRLSTKDLCTLLEGMNLICCGEDRKIVRECLIRLMSKDKRDKRDDGKGCDE